ncbi:MAG TPA: hypothetical protein VFW48_03745, partial [Solirubrobacterales bacterium]|nr:hypothetical protein [Solirubrobacterales bacterium]
MSEATNAHPPDERPNTGLAIGVFGLVCALAVIAAFVYDHYRPELHLELKSFVILAPIYAAAQAIERLLEPLAAILHPAQQEKKEAKDAKAEQTQAQAAAEAVLVSTPMALLD